MQEKRLVPEARYAMTIGTAIFFFCTLIITYIVHFTYNLIDPQVDFDLQKFILAPFILLNICAFLYLLATPTIRYNRYRYLIADDRIEVREGLIWITRSIAPLKRLHKVEINQGPINRLFHLAKVTTMTAGGDVEIGFLPEAEAEQIAQDLKTRINTYIDAGGDAHV